MTSTKTKEITKKARMKAKRAAVTCSAPSGEEVTIQPPNLERHALSGGLPSRLKAIAEAGVAAVDKAIKEASEGDPETLTYLDGIVCRTLIDPEIEPPTWEMRHPKREDGEDDLDAPAVMTLIAGEDPNEYLLPIDYKWLLLVAFGETDFDGEGKRLWGREPVSRFRLFREEHGCAEDCDGCARVADRVSVGGAS